MESAKKLICFDLDGTLTPVSTWQLLNARLGITPEQDKQLFEEYLEEKRGYKEWLLELIKIYKTNAVVSKAELISFAESIELQPDARAAIDSAKAKNYTIAIISGSIDVVVRTIAQKLGIDVWFAKSTALFNENNELTDIETIDIGERDGKLLLLKEYCLEQGIDLASVICVEDGGNGLELFKHAKGIQLGDNAELAPLAWRQVQSLGEVNQYL